MKNPAMIAVVLLSLAASGCATAMPPAPYGGGGLAGMSEQHALYLPREQGTGVIAGAPSPIPGAGVNEVPRPTGSYDVETAGSGAASTGFNAPPAAR